jgi:hypothetical protein
MGKFTKGWLETVSYIVRRKKVGLRLFLRLRPLIQTQGLIYGNAWGGVTVLPSEQVGTMPTVLSE